LKRTKLHSEPRSGEAKNKKMIPVDVINLILFEAERRDVVQGFRFARIDKRRYTVFGIKSENDNLSQRGQYLRMIICNIDKVDWNGIAKNNNVPLLFLKYHKDKIKENSCILNNKNVTYEFLEENFTNLLSGRYYGKYLPLKIVELMQHIKNYKSYPNWGTNVYITYEFLEKHIDKISRNDWYGLMCNKHIPEQFFREHIDKLSTYYYISTNSGISTQFYEEHINYINWRGISINTGIPIEFFRKYSYKLDWRYLSENRNVPIEFLEEHSDKINWPHVFSQNKNITYSLCNRYKHLIRYDWISENKNIPLQFVEENLDKLDLGELSISRLPIKFFRKHLDKINWSNFSCKRM
jgi:hypothetical protein